MNEEERQATMALLQSAVTFGDAARSLILVMEGANKTTASHVRALGDGGQGTPPIDTSSVQALLSGMFTKGELERFSRAHTSSVSDRVNWYGGMGSVAHGYVSALERAGLLDDAFFGALRDARPRRKAEVQKVQDDCTRNR